MHTIHKDLKFIKNALHSKLGFSFGTKNASPKAERIGT